MNLTNAIKRERQELGEELYALSLLCQLGEEGPAGPGLQVALVGVGLAIGSLGDALQAMEDASDLPVPDGA